MKVVKVVNNQILYDAHKLELFIPDDYFVDGLATQEQNAYRIFGYCQAYHYMSENDTRDTAVKSVMACPLSFLTYPNSISDEVLNIGHGTEKYKVFTYYKNDIVMASSDIIQSGNDVLLFVKLIMAGKLDMVEYKDIPGMLQKNKLYNGVTFKLPAMYEEALIAEHYRDPKDSSRPARYAAVKATGKFYAKGISQREKVAHLSTFAGLTYEDITSMLTKADNDKRNGKVDTVSSLEKSTLSSK